ncbi:hypothetical protein CUN31_03350 [Enterococcus faecalis]|uniref:hypothetical protein n=1 Tax=Enterococcus faecalis TaxID=1351 RepID=UPI00030B7B36|nr:hypothetical protein [Enterococcus faecalis]EGO7617911.1 hypothetical protein [Enterococcus faecalis]EHZ2968479.1 hypothetical protein [Enterococcus faecalis]EIB6795286.1 hypothetical protein [Enterococcus faecalis]PQB33924.1 hypothetical protein CUN31_03350 [Enterococcus faecalis]PQB45740.1 hypothetical protein CUM81_08080 [Enterococcus faecalis]
MESYGLRIISKFIIEDTIEVYKNTNLTKCMGKIRNIKEKIKIKEMSFDIYDCEFYRDKKSDIIVDGSPISEFKEVNYFKIYCCQKKSMLVANVSLNICTPFLKYLEASNPNLVEYSKINFDYTKIVRNKALVDQIWFGTSDQHARTKSFNGVRVDKNTEAMNAIQGGKATFIKAQIDVSSNGKNKKRTIGFSKKSGITIFKTNDSEINDFTKHFMLLLDTYNTYSTFK